MRRGPGANLEPAPEGPWAAEAFEAFPDDTGGPRVTLPTRGTLRVESVREDGSPEPDATFELVGCEWVRPLERGSTSRWRVQRGPCTVVAWRSDGLLETPHQRAAVTIATGQETLVTFRFPVERTGGLGVQLATTDLGIEVGEVVPGSPADAAGLAPGDWILEVDGEEVVDLTAEELAERLVGAEDTPIRLTLAFEGDTGLVEQTIETFRAYLPHDE